MRREKEGNEYVYYLLGVCDVLQLNKLIYQILKKFLETGGV